jgi:hypothetical protein
MHLDHDVVCPTLVGRELQISALRRTAVSLNSSLYRRTVRGPDRGIVDTPGC